MLDLIAEGIALRNNPPNLPGVKHPQFSANTRSNEYMKQAQSNPHYTLPPDVTDHKTRNSAKSAKPPAFELSIEALNFRGIEVTPDDLAFLRHRLPLTPDKRDALLGQYIEIWQRAMQGECAPHRKQNKGRFAANTWLRERNR